MTDTQQIVTHFCISETVNNIAALGEGFINDTFVVTTSGCRYILQRKNRAIFPNVPGLTANIVKVTNHIRQKAIQEGIDPKTATLQLIATKESLPSSYCYKDNLGDFWTCCTYIEDSITYQKADTLELVAAGGAGVGQFQAWLADFKGDLEETLPGFHNIRYRFQQFEQAVALNAAGRTADLTAEIEQITCRKETMMDFYQMIENGEIPRRISHNDTKLSNFLFDKQGKVMCAIDLDTVMQSSVLYDFGDAIRSYANTAEEDCADTSKVRLDLDRYASFAKGYLSTARSFLSTTELSHLAFSALYITFEQYLRFLMDYINGDTYYKIHYPAHNLVRSRAQLALLLSMEAQYREMKEVIQII